MNPLAEDTRLNYLDAVRAFALLLGIVFHASLSFMPVFMGWAVMDVSTSPLVASFVLVSHSFRMELFFLIAGFFSHMTFHEKGSKDFLKSRFLRIIVPFALGWFILRPLIVSGWIMGSASLRGEVDVAAGLVAGFQSLATLPNGIFTGSHLWFLYYLALITVAILALRWLMTRTGSGYSSVTRMIDSALVWLASSPISLLALAVPTAVALWFMRMWGMDTPDQSLTPHIPVTLVYGGFFAFGWMLQRNQELVSEFARLTVSRWLIVGVSLVAVLMLARFQFEPRHPRFDMAHIGFVASYALMMWSLVFITIGVFKKLFSRQNPLVRYVADSSYWLYLVHLPIVAWLQVAFAELPLHWSIKLAAISVLTVLVSLLLYDLIVRSTLIGRVLNGRRKERMLFRTTGSSRMIEPV